MWHPFNTPPAFILLMVELAFLQNSSPICSVNGGGGRGSYFVSIPEIIASLLACVDVYYPPVSNYIKVCQHRRYTQIDVTWAFVGAQGSIYTPSRCSPPLRPYRVNDLSDDDLELMQPLVLYFYSLIPYTSTFFICHLNCFVYVFFLLINLPPTLTHSWQLVRQTSELTDLPGEHPGPVGAQAR